jgi:PAS domain S-box-containing protein
VNKGKTVTPNETDHTADLPDLKDFFKLLFEEVPCYISVQDRDLNIVQSNRRFKEDFGDVSGVKCHQIYKHSDDPCVYCPVAETFSSGKSHQSEEIVISREGERINTLVSTAPIVNSAGEIALVIEMSTNITKVRDLEERLTNIGMLVGSISHGLRGLLMGLDGGTYLLNTGLEKSKQKRV